MKHDVEAFRRAAAEASEWIARYLEDPARFRVNPDMRPGDLMDRLPASGPEQGEPLARIQADFEGVILPAVTHWNHPRFFNYFACTASVPGVIAEMLAASMNTNGLNWIASPAVSELEQVALGWLREWMALDAGYFGQIFDTASISTMHAVMAAQKDWAVNNPAEVAKVVAKLETIQQVFKRVSLADLIVLGGTAAIEQAAKAAGTPVQVPFAAGRVDATQAQTDASTFAVLEPVADGFRNYYNAGAAQAPAEMLVDRAKLLTLTVPEMTALVGGMRVLNANTGAAAHGVFTDKAGVLKNDFFVNLLDMSTKWEKAGTEGIYEGKDRATGKVKWTATPVDLVFGSNSELRAISEVYASADGQEKFVRDFAKAWAKVMNLDRFDLR